MKNDGLVVPNFNKDWLLTKQQSLFADWQTKRHILLSSQSGDSSKREWIGYVWHYRTKDDLGRGISYDLLGRGEIYKFWGLRGEKLSQSALLVGNIWVCFSRSRFTFNFNVHPDKQGQGGVGDISIFVYGNDYPELIRFAVSILKYPRV